MRRVTLKKLIFTLLCTSITTWFLMQAYVTTNRRNFAQKNDKIIVEANPVKHIEKSNKNVESVKGTIRNVAATVQSHEIIDTTFVDETIIDTTIIDATVVDTTIVKDPTTNVGTTLVDTRIVDTTLVGEKNADTTKNVDKRIVDTALSSQSIKRMFVANESNNSDIVGNGQLLNEIDEEGETLCPKIPPGLEGPLLVDSTYVPTFEEALTAAGDKINMGCYKPDSCTARQRVAIIIPYKNREEHLITLSRHIHPILQRQMLHYCVFVAEQYDNGIFNKARIMNAAYMEVRKIAEPLFDCIVFHDVDMLIEDDRNMYVCDGMPKHMSTAIDKFNYTTGYGTEFGGVTAISVKHYALINGHSNDFWGWGGEDNDIESRIHRSGLKIDKVDERIGRFKMIKHKYPWRFSPLSGVGSWIQWKKFTSKQSKDHSGLSNLKYALTYIKKEPLWIKLTIDIRTVVIEKAKVHFLKTHDADVEFTSKAIYTEGVHYKEDCHYVKFTGKNVNKTLGLINKIEYGRVRTLGQAMIDCNKMDNFCQSIVEEHMGQFSLRATPYMKNNTISYMTGLVHPTKVVEKHRTVSVHVKVCPGDTDYVSVIQQPIVLDGDEKMGTSPAFSVELTMRLYNPSNSILTFVTDIDTVHRKVQRFQMEKELQTFAELTSLGRKTLLKHRLIQLNDTKEVQKYLVKETVLKDGSNSSLLSVKMQPTGLTRIPGFYVAKCSVVDEMGTSVMAWDIWFEIRGKTEEINAKFEEAEFETFLKHSANFKMQNKIPKTTGIHISHPSEFKANPPEENSKMINHVL